MTVENLKYIVKRHIKAGQVYTFNKPIMSAKKVGYTIPIASVARNNRGNIFFRDVLGKDYKPGEFTEDSIYEIGIYVANYNAVYTLS